MATCPHQMWGGWFSSISSGHGLLEHARRFEFSQPMQRVSKRFSYQLRLLKPGLTDFNKSIDKLIYNRYLLSLLPPRKNWLKRLSPSFLLLVAITGGNHAIFRCSRWNYIIAKAFKSHWERIVWKKERGKWSAARLGMPGPNKDQNGERTFSPRKGRREFDCAA